MDKEQISQEIARPFLRPLGVLQFISLLTFLSSPFIWIWEGWGIAWKIGLTGLIAILITKFLYSAFEKVSKNKVDEELKKMEINSENSKSRFQKKIQKIMQEQNQ